MRLIAQRVTQASVRVQEKIVGEINAGLLILLGIGAGDGEDEARWLAHKTANLRVFADTEGKMNLSVLDIGGSVLVVPQFTLYGDIQRGFRPSFAHAAPPNVARPLVDRYTAALRAADIPVETGIFGAHMIVELSNDGPVTIIMEKAPSAT